jgi:hypothetical protein
MERKIVSLVLLAVLLAAAFVWGRLCAGWGRKRGWDEANSGRVAMGVALVALVPAYWEMAPFFGIMPAMAISARWSCFRVLRPGVAFSEMDQQFPAVDHRPVTLNLTQVEPKEKVR